MNQTLFRLFLLFSIFNAYSQDLEATLYFRDGESFVGYGDIIRDKDSFTPEDKIAFRLSKDDEPSLWDGATVDKITLHFFESDRTYKFVTTKVKEKTRITLHEVVSEGEVDLYVYYSSGWVPNAPMPGFPHTGMRKVEKTSFYVKRETEDKFTTFGGGKKKIAAYFTDCPGIIKKLDTNEFNISTLEDIVNYYNDYCAGYDFEEDAGEEEIIEPEDEESDIED